jgi:hypothetical protein
MSLVKVLSPDGFTIDHNYEHYASMPAAVFAFEMWKKRYERQGYYSSNNGRISLNELKDHCQFISLEFLTLESVGTAIVIDDCMTTYAINSDGNTIDTYGGGVILEECTDEWFAALSDEDRQKIWDTFKYDASAKQF